MQQKILFQIVNGHLQYLQHSLALKELTVKELYKVIYITKKQAQIMLMLQVLLEKLPIRLALATLMVELVQQKFLDYQILLRRMRGQTNQDLKILPQLILLIGQLDILVQNQ